MFYRLIKTNVSRIVLADEQKWTSEFPGEARSSKIRSIRVCSFNKLNKVKTLKILVFYWCIRKILK